MAMSLTSEHLAGFLAGLGTAALGFYLYKRNKVKIDEFLRSQGIEIPGKDQEDYSSLTLKDLVEHKERLEDLIAEREMAGSTEVPVS